MPVEIPLSIVIITLNEEARLRHCLEALVPGAEIIILDSGSTDKTIEIAKEYGAFVYTRNFDNYAAQKNAALDYVTRKWVLSLDADEVLDSILRKEINSVIYDNNPCAAYKVNRSLVYMGKKLRFGKTRDCPIRLFQNKKAKFLGDIHEKLEVDGEIAFLKGELLHYSYKDLDDYFNRFNSYTKKIAKNHFKNKKRIFLPFHYLRPFLEFIYRYLLLLGCLDGAAGFSYALVSSLYAFVKYEKLREMYLIEKRNIHGT